MAKKQKKTTCDFRIRMSADGGSFYVEFPNVQIGPDTYYNEPCSEAEEAERRLLREREEAYLQGLRMELASHEDTIIERRRDGSVDIRVVSCKERDDDTPLYPNLYGKPFRLTLLSGEVVVDDEEGV